MRVGGRRPSFPGPGGRKRLRFRGESRRASMESTLALREANPFGITGKRSRFVTVLGGEPNPRVLPDGQFVELRGQNGYSRPQRQSRYKAFPHVFAAGRNSDTVSRLPPTDYEETADFCEKQRQIPARFPCCEAVKNTLQYTLRLRRLRRHRKNSVRISGNRSIT